MKQKAQCIKAQETDVWGGAVQDSLHSRLQTAASRTAQDQDMGVKYVSVQVGWKKVGPYCLK